MRILGIESAALTASVAVVTDGALTAEYTLNMKKTHSQTLLPMIDDMMRMLGIDISSVDAIAVSGGPGSFTGLRIGSATAKGIGLATGKPLVHVPTIDAMAYTLFGVSALICPMLDARRQQVYTGFYRFEDDFTVVKPQFMTTIDKLVRELNARGEKVIFLGDGVDTCGAYIREHMTAPYVFAPVPANRQRGAAVAALGEAMYREGKTVSAMEFAPDYMRKSQAERERDLAEERGEMDKLAQGIVVREEPGK